MNRTAAQPLLRATLRGALNVLFRRVIGLPAPERFQRHWLAMVSAATLGARDVTCSAAPRWGGVCGLHLQPAGSQPDTTLLYLHGGGYTLGSSRTHRALGSHLAAQARCRVVIPDYRLAPEHPYPAALEDAIAVYCALLEQQPSQRIAIGGDSAGGGLALCVALALRDRGLPLPAALLLISPWTDLTLSGESHVGQRDADPMLSHVWLDRAGRAYRGQLPASDPCVSPLFADLRGLPPTLVQVGSDEILLSDATRLAERAAAAGVDLHLDIEPGLWHDFQMHAGVLRAADAALRRIATFLDHAWRTGARA